MIDPYYDRVNLDLLSLIPPDAGSVLELGCGTGALCRAYKRINPGVEWHGIDSNPDVWVDAKDHMIEMDICDLNEGVKRPANRFDVLVLGDILEHLTDPWQVLSDAATSVKPGGQVLASIPNVAHWTIILGLLMGKFEYGDDGLLDRTHLRFFTLESIRAMFQRVGLHTFEIVGRDLFNNGFSAFAQMLGDLPHDTRQLRAFQYLVRAVKPVAIEADRRIDTLRIHAVVHRCYLNGTVCERPRIDEPFAALRTIPGVTCTKSERGSALIMAKSPDIIIQQRCQIEEPIGFIPHWKCAPWEQRSFVNHEESIGIFARDNRIAAMESILVADWDDDLEAFESIRSTNGLALRAVHAVQVSTERMAETVRKYNPNVMVFENQLAELPPWEDKEDAGDVSIFFGALNRESDWAPIMPAINRIIKERRPDNLNFYVVHDRAFFDALETGQKVFYQFLPYEEYRNVLRSCDIALLPLEPTRFNEHKSDLKFLECAAEGVAVLASETVYLSPIVACQTDEPFPGRNAGGEIYQTPDQFKINLQLLIDEPHFRRSLAESAYAYIRDHRMLGQHYRKRYEWYQQLRKSKPDLDRQLLARCPELRQHQPAHAETSP